MFWGFQQLFFYGYYASIGFILSLLRVRSADSSRSSARQNSDIVDTYTKLFQLEFEDFDDKKSWSADVSTLQPKKTDSTTGFGIENQQKNLWKANELIASDV